MKRMPTLISIVIVLAAIVFSLFGDPVLYFREKRLQKAVAEIAAETIFLSEVTPFEWDAVYTFSPYTSKKEIEETIGFSSAAIEETVSEGMTHLLFVKGKRVVCSVCAYPGSIGFGVSGMPSRQPLWNKEDGPKFRVKRRANVVWLEFLAETEI